jgi:predicted deacylase
MEDVRMRSALLKALMAWFVALPLPTIAQQREPLSVGDVTATPGTAASGYLRIPPAAGDNGTDIPITVVHGRQPGPVVSIVAGVHGSEYPPILALQELRRRLVARELRGSVILVHCANPPSFFARTVYYGPSDWQNLNRVFPGAVDGTLSYRIADAVIQRVIVPADVLVDVHGGDANEALRSYAAIMLTGDIARDARTRVLGNALGFDRMIETTLSMPIPAPARYLTRAAASMGKISVAIESGELGRRDNEYVQPIVDGLLNLLRVDSMIPGRPIGHSPRERYASNRTVVSPVSGILWPHSRLGQRLVKGDTLAVVTDLLGESAAVIVSPEDGVVMYQAMTPPISAGETAAAIGVSLPRDSAR